MATRHQVRRSIIAFLYAKDVGNDNIEEFIDDMLEDCKIRNEQKKFALSLFYGVSKYLNEIDYEINKYLKQWQMKDLSYIERSILRLGAYEILKTDLDKAVVINEAIELSKSFGGENTAKLINGVLDSMKKEEK